MIYPYIKIANNRIEYIDKTPKGAVLATLEYAYENHLLVTVDSPIYGLIKTVIKHNDDKLETSQIESIVYEALCWEEPNLDDSRKTL